MPGTDPAASRLDPLELPGARGCTVWRAPVVVGRWEPLELLDPAERQRYDRFRQPADQARYATAHTLLRLLLAAYLDTVPRALRFDTTCRHCGSGHGKPRLAADSPGGGSTVDFSLSHAGDRVLIAVARRPVGVDIEHTARPTDVAALAPAVLAPQERAGFDELPAGRQEAAFYTYWTRKEAVLKATGHGLAVPMSALCTSGPGEPARLLHWTATRPQPGPIQLHDLATEPEYRACVAALGPEPLAVTEKPAPEPSAARSPG